MPKKLQMFPLLINQWYGETRRMTLEESGAYLGLLLYLFDERRPIKDEQHVAKILDIDPRTSRRLWPKLRPNFARNQHGFQHELVKKILNNNGRIKGLSKVAEGVAIPKQEKEKEMNKPPPNPPSGKKSKANRQSNSRRSRSARRGLQAPHPTDHYELRHFAKKYGIPIPESMHELYLSCCDYARKHNAKGTGDAEFRTVGQIIEADANG
ncbi:MAG: hypothetical protein N0C81_10080 [Candidatus Thiodiazotropha lotti]|nr:hypothetical protein [Candidatus Thiodiazotropha lotti]MCW4195566.1 hypothetical protein [Candidatus Thiodiazotropha lotti]